MAGCSPIGVLLIGLNESQREIQDGYFRNGRNSLLSQKLMYFNLGDKNDDHASLNRTYPRRAPPLQKYLKISGTQLLLASHVALVQEFSRLDPLAKLGIPRLYSALSLELLC